MKRLLFIGVTMAVPMLFLSCFGSGSSSRVSDCGECYRDEYCVNGDGSLYCANPCVDDFDCDTGFWCVPLTDQGTSHASMGRVRWVCMPDQYYTNEGSVRRMGGDCNSSSQYACNSDETCLYDDSGYFDTNTVYFCASACSLNSDCLTGCCQQAEGSNYYCTPSNYCTQ